MPDEEKLEPSTLESKITRPDVSDQLPRSNFSRDLMRVINGSARERKEAMDRLRKTFPDDPKLGY